MRKITALAGILLFFYGCNPVEKKQKEAFNYFDLKGYFEKEAKRLKKNNPEFIKTVIVNGAAETKRIRIADWTKEFAIFSDADMNRNAWKGLFTVQKNDEQEIYSSNNEKVSVKQALILKRQNEIRVIRIVIKNSNILYNSIDTLYYYPDSLYEVRKKQHIRLLDEKNYRITGKFK